MSIADTVLITTWPNIFCIADNFATAIAEAFQHCGYKTRIVDICHFDDKERINVDSLVAVFSLGDSVTRLYQNKTPIYKLFRCPVYLYLLDSPIYLLLLNGKIKNYFVDSMTNPGLHVVLPDRSYVDLYSSCRLNGRSPNVDFMPTAPFPAACRKIPRSDRAVVIGNLESELYYKSGSDSLEDVIIKWNPFTVPNSKVSKFISAVTSPEFKGNTAMALVNAYDLHPSLLLDSKFLNYACVIDSHIKRHTRLKAIESLQGFPTDFYGAGWSSAFEGVDDFEFLGLIPHHDIGSVVQQYKVCINFDPMWEHGIHDRAFTALDAGCSLVTNANEYLQHVPGKIYQYQINSPNLRTLAAQACAEFVEPASGLLGHSWSARIQSLLSTQRIPALPGP